MSRFHGTTLRLVRDMGPLSRTELMHEMGISSPSLTKIANRLIEAGLLGESDQRTDESFGRPRQYLDLLEGGWRVVCASLMPGRLEVGVADKDATILASRSLDLATTAIDAIPHLLRETRALLTELGTAPDRVAGFCLTVPGQVDLAGRRLLAVSRPDWGEGPLVEALEAGMPWPVTIENKVNAMAFAEAVIGRRKDQNALVYLYLDQGLGAAFMREERGTPFSGRDSLELGHVRVETPGRPCLCGQTGCFETVLTADLLRGSDDALSGPEWPVIAQGIANLVNLLNPETIVLGGELARMSAPQHAVLFDRIRERLMPHQRENIRLRPCVLGPQATLQGAAAVALDRFYYSGGTL